MRNDNSASGCESSRYEVEYLENRYR